MLASDSVAPKWTRLAPSSDPVPLRGSAPRPTMSFMFQRAEVAVPLAGVEACRRFFADCVDSPVAQGTLWVAYLDREARCIDLTSYPAGRDATIWPVSRIVEQAARLGSVGMVVAQRRNGSALTPLSANVRSSRRLALAAEAMDVALLDHLVFSGRECTSLRRAGLL